MPYKKGDLVLVKEVAATQTYIVLTERYNITSGKKNDFYYCYCLETGLYSLIYDREIISLVSEGFAPDALFDHDLFESDYRYYADLYDKYAYFPSFFKAFLPEEWESEEDSSEHDSSDEE